MRPSASAITRRSFAKNLPGWWWLSRARGPREWLQSKHTRNLIAGLRNSPISEGLPIKTEIRKDSDGRYCLNDLHRAAGGEKRIQPSDWLRLKQTHELVAELDRSIPVIPGIQARQGLGTFVAKELVYAYAMWIRPAFDLKVSYAGARPSAHDAEQLHQAWELRHLELDRF